MPMASWHLVVFALCLTTVSGLALGTQLMQGAGRTLRSEPTFSNPSVCNGYAWSMPLVVYRDLTRLTEEPLEFGQCVTLNIDLKLGDTFVFTIDGRNLGRFDATELPPFDARLFLLAFRKDESTDVIEFRSHAFEVSDKAQVAVVDVFRGDAFGMMRVLNDAESSTSLANAPILAANTVTSLDPGEYHIWLLSMFQDKISSVKLHVEDKGVYILMRLGSDNRGLADDQAAIPQTLFVYPSADDKSSVSDEHNAVAKDENSAVDEQSSVAEDDSSATVKGNSVIDENTEEHNSVTEEENAASDEKSSEADEHNSVVVDEKTEEHNSVAEEESSAVDEKSSTADEHKSATEDENSAIDENTDEHSSVTEEDNAAADGKGSEADEHESVTEEENSAGDEKSPVADEKDAVADEKDPISHENPVAHENPAADQTNTVAEDTNSVAATKNSFASPTAQLNMFTATATLVGLVAVS